MSVDWDDEVYFEVTAGNGICAGSITFYGELEEFVQFGNELADFPNTVSHKVTFEIGDGETYEQLLLEAYCCDPAGHTALRLIMRSGQEGPQSYKAYFSIIVEAATLNRIGKKLATWNVKENKALLCFRY